MATGENRLGSKQSREKEREQQINGVRDRAIDGNRNGVG